MSNVSFSEKTAQKALYSFTDVEAHTAKPLSVNGFIKSVVKANDEAAWKEMLRFLMPPGVSGSRQFDQAYAVDVLLRHDAKTGGHIAIVMESTGMSRRMLWDRLQTVIRNVGFQMSHGRLIGVKEGVEMIDNGQPDID